MSFVHLHNHTHFSLLDATTKPEELIKAAAADGQTAIAMTDHGVMFGTIEFYKACRAHKIKPIIGIEAYIASGSRFDKPKPNEKNYYHIILLAKDQTGYKNLLQLASLGFTEGFYRKPRIDREILEKYHEGLVCTSACMGGIINADVINGDIKKAKEEADYYKSLFGDDFYMEIQRHNYSTDERLIEISVGIAREKNIKIVCTNDIHYLKQEHSLAHNVLLGIASSSKDYDYKTLRYQTDEFYFKTTAEMKELFSDFPDAIQNTVEIADKCNLKIDLTTLYMPVYPIPETSEAKNLSEYLIELSFEKLNEKFKGEVSEKYKARLEFELKVINDMKFPGYFLITQDLINVAKADGVPVGPGRGSAAGSLVAYALGITNIDPIKYDLLFERFLNPERVSMPDIDIDFCDQNRYKVIEYVKKKYGEDAVAQIVTFGKLTSKAVIADVGRVLGVSLIDVRKITACIPTEGGQVMKLKDALQLPDLKTIINASDSITQEFLDIALTLEGVLRGRGTHAAGVIIAPSAISNYVPICTPIKSKVKADKGSEGIVTQFPNNHGEIEEAGLLKMDFLGLQTLSIISNTLDMIERNTGERIDIDKIPLDDKKTYDMISEGNTIAIFQFESQGMREYLKQLKPSSIEDLTAMNALYRPGPMDNIPDFIKQKRNPASIRYLVPIMEPILKNTYGIIVYQEQVMQLVRDLGGFSLGEADVLRRAMGKKKTEVMDEMKPKFYDGAAKKGIDRKSASAVFELIEKFAKYGFNKSHSVAYSYVAYQTAWLKAHYPAEFLAANMTAKMNVQNDLTILIEEADKFKIKVLPPDINSSFAFFHAANSKEIFYGMAGIRNVGIPIVEDIVRARENAPFESYIDFCTNVEAKSRNRRALEALISSGTFDKIEDNKRASLFESIDLILDYAKHLDNEKTNQTINMFGEIEASDSSYSDKPNLKQVEEWSKKIILSKEKEYLNFYLSGHPLSLYENIIEQFTKISVTELKNMSNRTDVTFCGLISQVSIKRNKNNESFAVIKVEDFDNSCECVLMPNVYEPNKEELVANEPVYISGKLRNKDDEISVMCDRVLLLDNAVKKFAKGFKLFMNVDDEPLDKLELLKKYVDSQVSEKKEIIFSLYSLNDDRYRKDYTTLLNFAINDDTYDKLCELFDTNKKGNVKYYIKQNS